MLTAEQISELAHREGVRTVAVENFLHTLSGLTQAEALANLELDCRSYGWNAQTSRAIQEGIMRAGLPADRGQQVYDRAVLQARSDERFAKRGLW